MPAKANQPPTLTVSPRGTADYREIADAVKNARPGTTILVKPGEYTGPVRLGKRLRLVGEGPRGEVVLSAATDESVLELDGAELVSGITVRQTATGDGTGGPAASVISGQTRIEGCVFSTGQAICLCVTDQETAPTFCECEVRGGQVGVLADVGAAPRFERCLIVGQATTGVTARNGGQPALIECTVRPGGCGVFLAGGGVAQLDRCELVGGSGVGIVVEDTSLLEAVGCVVEGCEGGGASATGGSVLKLRGCTIRDPGGYCVSVGIDGPSEATASAVIRECEFLRAGANGVQVGFGSSLLMHLSRVIGSARGGVMVTDEATGVVEGCEIRGSGHAGVYVWNQGQATVRLCVVADSVQAGVFVYERGEGSFEDCEIFDNGEAGVEVTRRGKPTLRRCRIRGNALGAVQLYQEGQVVAEGCDLTGNHKPSWNLDGTEKVTDRKNKVD